jgi:SAM-dependent methyltransferase
MHPKRFYEDYLADNGISPLSEELLRLIKQDKPNSVLEFGCGTGKHLKALPSIHKKFGIDLSLINIIHGNVKNGLHYLFLGDEDILTKLQDIDVVFTCSVLDHIEKIDSIIQHMKRIANKTIYLAETLDTPHGLYYAHDYDKFGFKETGFKWVSPKPEGDGATYQIWKLLCAV